MKWFTCSVTEGTKALQAIPSQGNLNNLLPTAVIFPRMHNANAKFNNKRNGMTSKEPALWHYNGA